MQFFKKSGSIVTRVFVAKALGFILGAVGFFMLQFGIMNPDLFFNVGLWLWYTTLGGIIGLFGVIDRHPIFKFDMPAWFRGGVLGFFMNLVLTFFVYEEVTILIEKSFDFSYTNPFFWLPLEGLIVGVLIDVIATHYGGEGKKIL